MRRWFGSMLLLLLFCSTAHAGDGLDVKDWLSRPGVKMLAVEFYATWCKPCMRAVPRWRALHEKYRNQGLRLVVVSVQDPDGTCVNPGWNPDDVVCDSEGHLSQAWGVGAKLPGAFLWSWRGTLLVRRGHVDEVENAVEEELSRLPRVTLDEGMDKSIRELLRAELARTGKVDVIAGQEEKKALDEIRKKSHGLQFSEQSACVVGAELAANSLLKASLVKAGTGERLLVHLFSAETGCLSSSAGVFWNPERPEVAVAEAVAKLVTGLKVEPELPGKAVAKPVAIQTREIGEEGSNWTMEVQAGILVTFQSDPSGATVLVGGRLQCQQTPCTRTFTPGQYTVEMQKESYLPDTSTITVAPNMKPVHLTLTPDFGWITVRSEPSGLPVLLDGTRVGVTPLERHPVSTGPHEILVSDPRYYDRGKQVQIERGDSETVDVQLLGREGGLVVYAQDENGNDLQAEVWLDGTMVGTTPYAGQVLVGKYQLRVAHGGLESARDVEVREKTVEKVSLELTKPAVPVGIWLDPVSGLKWQVTPTGGTMIWSLAVAHCEALSLAGGGWRLPTIGELRSLIRGCPATQVGGTCNVSERGCVQWGCRHVSCQGCPSSSGPASGSYWPSGIWGPRDSFWSSSSVSDQADFKWRVNFDQGSVEYGLLRNAFHVRCVR